jgi:hypothetical protein
MSLRGAEKRGAKNLAKSNAGNRRGRLFVRIYYYGDDGDLLCFDVGPMGPSGVDTLCKYLDIEDERAGHDVLKPRGTQASIENIRDGIVCAQILGAHEHNKRRPLLDARLVTLPSQTTETNAS